MSLIEKLIPEDRRPPRLVGSVLESLGSATFFIFRDMILKPDMPDVEIPLAESWRDAPVYRNPKIRELAQMEERIRFLHLESLGYPLPHAITLNAIMEVIRYKMLNASSADVLADDARLGLASHNCEDGTVEIEFRVPIPRVGLLLRNLKAKVGASALAVWLDTFPAKLKKDGLTVSECEEDGRKIIVIEDDAD